MKSVGGQMSSVVAIMKGNVFSENLGTHIAALAQMAEIVPTVFPEGSGFTKSEALPKIWEQPAEFKKHMDDFVAAARKLGSVGPAGDMAAIGPAVQALGKTCKGCHDDFRKKDEE